MSQTGICLLAISLVAAGCQPASDVAEMDPASYLKGIVTIGVNDDIPGWSEYVNGVRSGFDVELVKWLGEELDFKPQFTNVTTAERMGKLEDTSSGFKLVSSNFSMTDKRRETVDFVGPYFLDRQSFLTLREANLTELSQIDGARVCMTSGSTSQARIGERKDVGGISVMAVPENTHRRCIERLKAGDVTAVTSDLTILESFAARDPQTLRVTGKPFGTERYGIGLPNNRPKLCEFLKPYLEKFINRVWLQKFTENLPSGVGVADRRPDSGSLDPCQQPDHALAAPAALAAATHLRSAGTQRNSRRFAAPQHRPRSPNGTNAPRRSGRSIRARCSRPTRSRWRPSRK